MTVHSLVTSAEKRMRRLGGNLKRMGNSFDIFGIRIWMPWKVWIKFKSISAAFIGLKLTCSCLGLWTVSVPSILFYISHGILLFSKPVSIYFQALDQSWRRIYSKPVSKPWINHLPNAPCGLPLRSLWPSTTLPAAINSMILWSFTSSENSVSKVIVNPGNSLLNAYVFCTQNRRNFYG